MAKGSLSSLSTSDLVRELDSRRDAIAAELAQLEAVLGRSSLRAVSYRRNVVAGRTPGRSARKTRRSGHFGPRPGNTMTLTDAMARVIGTGRKSVAEIVAGIPSTGYKTRSKDLATMAAIQLANRKDRFRRVTRGVYAVKK